MTMTKADFAFIAGVISNLPREGAIRQTAAQAFADDLRIVNPGFNERIFMDAAGVTQLIIPASRLKVGDFILEWGTCKSLGIENDGDTIVVKTDTSVPGSAFEFGRHEPVRIERLS